MRVLPVAEPSQIAAARRAVMELATTLSADATLLGKVALVTTELATNVLKHGGGGELLLSVFETAGGGTGVQLIALDQGPGIHQLERSFRDGYSTLTGSAGNGLGSIRRNSSMVQIATWPGLGTAVLVRLLLQPSQLGSAATVDTIGVISVPKVGEEVCGDAWAAAETATTRTWMVADGLGHGGQAAIAATEAVRIFNRNPTEPVPSMLERLHTGLRATRGAAVAIARVDLATARVTYGGIGNIAGTLVAGQDVRRMISLAGTAGHVARRVQAFDYPNASGWIVMHSDGLASSWSLERYAGLAASHPVLIAAVLYRDFKRTRDDVTVLVARLSAAA